MTVEINYQGIPLICEGTYYEGEKQTGDYPGSPHEFDFENVYVLDSQINIFDLLDLETLKELTLNKIS